MLGTQRLMTIPRSKYHANLPPFADFLTRLYLDRARLSLAQYLMHYYLTPAHFPLSLKTKVAKSVEVINLLPLRAT